MDPGIMANWGLAIGSFFLAIAGIYSIIHSWKSYNSKKIEDKSNSENGKNQKYVLQQVCDARYGNLESRLSRIEKKLDNILEKM